MAIIAEITGLEHLNCIKVGEVPKLIAIQLEARVIKIWRRNKKQGEIK